MQKFKEIDRIKMFSNLMENYISDDFKKWLIEKDFFKAPASTCFHSSYAGGLFDHSYIVTDILLSFTRRLNLKWRKERSPYIVGMFHDICKIDNYIMNKNGIWEFNKKASEGHGDKSVSILEGHITLTEEEISCIRWHMGAFDLEKNWKYYSKAIEKYSNVLYTHTADMVATKILKV